MQSPAIKHKKASPFLVWSAPNSAFSIGDDAYMDALNKPLGIPPIDNKIIPYQLRLGPCRRPQNSTRNYPLPVPVSASSRRRPRAALVAPLPKSAPKENLPG